MTLSRIQQCNFFFADHYLWLWWCWLHSPPKFKFRARNFHFHQIYWHHPIPIVLEFQELSLKKNQGRSADGVVCLWWTSNCPLVWFHNLFPWLRYNFKWRFQQPPSSAGSTVEICFNRYPLVPQSLWGFVVLSLDSRLRLTAKGGSTKV